MKQKKKGKVSYGDNLYELKGSYWLIFMHHGKLYRERIGKVRDIPLTMARNIATKRKAEIIEGTFLPKKEENVAFRELAQKYLRWYKSTRPQAKRRTSYEIERKVRMLSDYFKDMPLHQISSFTIEQYKQDRVDAGIKLNTINSELTILRAILRKAKELGLYSGEVPKVELYKVDDSRLNYLTPEQAKRLISACPDWLRPAVEFAIYTGLRASELFSLKWQDVNLHAGYITIQAVHSKNKETSRLPLNSMAIDVLKRLSQNKTNSEYVFTNSRGKPYKVEDKTYLRAFKTACKKAGIEGLRFHDLRHTFASWLAMAGEDLYTIQHLTRHKSTQMVKRYAHLSSEHLRQATEKIGKIVGGESFG